MCVCARARARVCEGVVVHRAAPPHIWPARKAAMEATYMSLADLRARACAVSACGARAPKQRQPETRQRASLP